MGMTGGVPDLGTPTQPQVTMAASPQTVNVTSPPPNDQMQPTQPTAQTGTIPLEPQDQYQEPGRTYVRPHETWYHAVAGAVGSILGGPKTVVVGHDAQGNAVIQEQPSTLSEKWGRVAQAALKGMAAGVQVPPGPGNMAAAAGAGLQTGLALPQQRMQQAQNQITQDANNALMHQKLMSSVIDMRQAGLTLAQNEAGILNSVNDGIKSSPNATLLATGKDMADVMKQHAQDPTFLANLTDRNVKTFPTIDKDGNPALQMWRLDPSYLDSFNKTPGQMPKTIVPDPTTGKPELGYDDYGPNSDTNRNLSTASQARIGEYLTRLNQWNTANAKANPQDKVPKNSLEAYAMAAQTNDAAEKANYTTLGDKLQQKELQLRTAGRPVTNLGAGGSDEMSRRELVDGMKSGDIDITKLVGIRNNSTLRAELVAQAMREDPTFSMRTYPVRLKTAQDFATGPESDQIQSFNQYLGHVKLLSQGVAQLRNTQSPLLNTPLNKLRTMANSNPQAAEVLPVLEAAQNEFQNFIHNNRALHSEDVQAGDQILNKDMGPAAMEQAMKGMSKTALTRLATVNEKYRRAMGGKDVPDLLDNEAQDALDVTGLRPYAQNVLGAAANRANTAATGGGGGTTPTPAPAAGGGTQPTKVVPPGAQPGYRNGQLVGYQNAQGWHNF
jgi:hypothetical protein